MNFRLIHVVWIVGLLLSAAIYIKKHPSLLHLVSQEKKTEVHAPDSSYTYTIPGFSKCDGSSITLHHNGESVNMSWNDVMTFLQENQTEKKAYEPGVYTCAHFAEDLYNRAQSVGLRCGVVVIEFKDQVAGHAINAFETTDKGLVFVDATGLTTDTDVKLPPVKSVGYLKEGETYFSIPLEVSLARQYPSDLSAGRYYLNERSRLMDSEKRLGSQASEFKTKVLDYQSRQQQLNQRINNWNQEEKDARARNLPQADLQRIEGQREVLQQQQDALNSEFDQLKADEDQLNHSQTNIEKQSDYLKWYNKTSDAPVSYFKVYW
jgi:hypothetical protein